MGNAADVLVFKLMIDGKEAIATLDLTKGEFLETGAAATAAQEKIQNAYKNLSAEALKYNAVNEGNVKSLTDYIRTQSISIDMVENTITVLQNEIKTLDVNSEGWKQKTAAATNIKAAYGQLITQHTNLDGAQRSVLPNMNSMNVAMGQFGYLIGDADMFMMNFRMGLMSIGNNIPMVIQYMRYAQDEAKGLNMTLGQAFMQSIKGTGGLLVGINLAVFAAQILARAFSETTKEVEKDTDAIKKNADALKELSAVTINNRISDLEKEVDLLKKKKEIEKAAFEQEQSERNTRRNLGGTTVAATFEYSGQAELTKQETMLQQAQAQASTLGKEINLRNRINELSDERANLTGREVNYNERLLFLNEQIKKKQEDLNDIQGKENKGDKEALNKLKQFASAKSKIQEDLFKDELLAAAKSDLNGKDYVQLLEMKEDAENKYREHLKTFNDAKSQTELDGFNFVRDVMEKNIELIDKKIDEEEKLTNKLR